jgi:hypothetical protein
MNRSFFPLLTVLILAGSAFADSITVTALGPAQHSVGNTTPGVFLFSLNGMTTVGFPDEAPGAPVAGQSWTTNVLPFSQFTQATFGADPDAAQDYEAAAWLILQEPRVSSGAGMAIQMAILALFNPAIENTEPWNAAAAVWLSKAEGNSYTIGEFSGFQILVPATCMTAECSSLELLVPPDAAGGSLVPESAAIALLGIGLLVLGGMFRRKLLSRPR